MLPNKVVFNLVKRHNANKMPKEGWEWALNVQFDGGKDWTIRVWGKEPSKQAVEKTKQIAFRSFEIFYLNLKIPIFNPRVENMEMYNECRHGKPKEQCEICELEFSLTAARETAAILRREL